MADCRLPDSALSRFDSTETETLRRILQENQALQPESALSITELPARREQAAEKFPEPAPVDRHPRKGKRPGIPGLLAAAAVAVLLLSIAINASGLWESIILWYENSFSLDSPHQDKPPLPTEEALGDFPEASAMLPTWFPEDYALGESSVQQSPIARIYWALFTGPRGDMRIRIGDYVDGSPTEYEYSDSLLEIYAVDGIQYYICRNYDTLVAVWLADRLECSIAGDITLEEMKQMIDSIGG